MPRRMVQNPKEYRQYSPNRMTLYCLHSLLLGGVALNAPSFPVARFGKLFVQESKVSGCPKHEVPFCALPSVKGSEIIGHCCYHGFIRILKYGPGDHMTYFGLLAGPGYLKLAP